MNKLIVGIILCSMVMGAGKYYGSSTAIVTLVGGTIRAKQIDLTQKYKRKDCPICEGQGWYWSGDGIEKIKCKYCEPEAESKPFNSGVLKSCPNGQCSPIKKK